MGSVKNIVWIVILLALIVGAVVFGISRTRRGETKMREKGAAQPMELIDVETLELITQPLNKWESNGKAPERFKNPKTGKYTMTYPMRCRLCGEKIPLPDNPEAYTAIGGTAPEYVCTRCGALAL